VTRRWATLSGVLWVLGVLGPAHGAAQTGPLQTEQAGTARARSVRLELLAQAIAGEPNFQTGHERGRFDGPTLRLVCSPADNVELDLEWVALVATPNDPDFGNAVDAGDVSLRAKLRLQAEDARRPALSARFAVTLPQTSFGKGLGPNTLRMFAQALASKARGRYSVHANIGLLLFDEVLRAHEQRDLAVYGVAVGRRLSGVTLLAELAGRAGSGAPGADASHELRLGARWRWHGQDVGVALRRGLGAADGGFGVVASLGVTLRHP
jgi:hypothetical protein